MNKFRAIAALTILLGCSRVSSNPAHTGRCQDSICSTDQTCVTRPVVQGLDPVKHDGPCPPGMPSIACLDGTLGCCAQGVSTLHLESSTCQQIEHTCGAEFSCKCLSADPCGPDTICSYASPGAIRCSDKATSEIAHVHTGSIVLDARGNNSAISAPSRAGRILNSGIRNFPQIAPSTLF